MKQVIESSKSIVVIGGGVIGLMLARHLNAQGHQVAVVDKNVQVASEASRAGGGIISPLHPWRYSQPMLDLAQWSHDRYCQIARELSLSTGIYVPVNKTGMLVPNVEEAEAALSCNFLQAERVTQQQVRQIEPGLATPRDSVWVPEVHNIRNPALCRALAKDMQQRKVDMLTDFLIQRVEKQGNEFVLQSTDQRQVSAEVVVVCAGAWSGQLLELMIQQPAFRPLDLEQGAIRQEMSTVPEIFPVKGQMLALKTRVGTLRSIILEGHRYLIPRHDGVVLVGSTVEPGAGFDKQTTQAALDELLMFAHQQVPALRYCPIISQWAGLRPGSHRDTPIISSVPKVEGLYVSMGHFRNGLLSAPASAQLMADLISNRPSVFDQAAYAL